MKKLKKFVAIILLITVCGGAACPTTVYAVEEVNNVKYPVELSVVSGSDDYGTDSPTEDAVNKYFEELSKAISSVDSTIFNNTFDWHSLESYFKDFDVASGNVGAVQSDISNLPHRLVYAYLMDASLYSRTALFASTTNESIESDDNSNWADIIACYDGFLSTSKLASSGESEFLNATLELVGSNRKYASDVKDKVLNAFDGSGPYDATAIVKIYDTPPSNYDSIAEVMNINRAVLFSAIYDYVYYATEWRESVVSTTLSGSDKSTLASLKLSYDTLKKYYPILGDLWTLKDPDKADDKSLKELCDENDVKGTELSFSLEEDYEHILGKDRVLETMYQLNNVEGIAGVNMENVVDDAAVNTEALQSLGDVIDEVAETKGVFAKIKTGLHGLKETVVHAISGVAESVGIIDNSQENLDENGIANDFMCVSLSDYITQGMAYSATYVPLKTNVYQPQVIKQYDKQFRDEFFYKYGFMRKAVYIDTSGSAVQDYYNSSGQSNTNRRICTLRDLIEVEDNDVMLYVDDDFYNAEEAIEEGNKINKQHVESVSEVYDILRQWATTNSAIEKLGNVSTDNMIMLTEGLTPEVKSIFLESVGENSVLANAMEKFGNYMVNRYNFSPAKFYDGDTIFQELDTMGRALQITDGTSLDNKALKNDDFSAYDSSIAQKLTSVGDTDAIAYRNVSSSDFLSEDNYDSIVLSSSAITDYFFATTSYSKSTDNGDGTVTINNYTSMDPYSPKLSLAWVSAIYRDLDAFTIANSTAHYSPIFMASDEVSEINEAPQWYRNTILNWALLKNLKSAAPLDYTYACDLDCPVYVDIFGNILSEGGMVVIPAASNATLHCASFHENNVAVGLYSVYGNDYYVPIEKVESIMALDPFFYPDVENKVYIINGRDITLGDLSVKYNAISPYDTDVQECVQQAYLSYIKEKNFTRVNWPVMVNIINEVMRGAPIENIDKDTEFLHTTGAKNKAAIVAAAKLEELTKSLKGATDNTLLSIPDFSRMDDFEYVVAFFIKIMIVATAAVVIIAIYRDGVSGQLGLRTFWKSLSSILLTFAAICVIPAVFQLTYYAANKYFLHDECMRILILNTEKRESGIEIGMLDTYTPDTTNDMALQLDWIRVPWYEQLENMLYNSTLQHLDDVKNEAYKQTPTYDNPDVTIHNDGVYITTDDLFESARIDYAFGGVSATGVPGLYIYSNNTLQTASYYSPYYAFLYALVANINEYNYYHDSYNYTTKMMSGNVIKTVGLCNDYFTSKSFMELDSDVMHLYEIYNEPQEEYIDRAKLFTEENLEQFQHSLWYNNIDGEGFEKRVELVNKACRDFIANNKDMLTKVSDETFIKVVALNAAIKYNQYFGITSANSLEIYNMDSNDLLRLSVVKADEAVLAAPYSYARYIYSFSGEPGIYAASVLTMIMWLGSFIKPLCTVIVFISVFLSIWVFRVVLRKPSANLLGYLVTVILLCTTNILHTVLLKISIYLPNLGLSALGCLIFLIFGQVCYLLVLGYVTGVSLKDWQNLGATEYNKEAQLIKNKFSRNKNDHLSGAVKHHEDNWEYYNDLVRQHRSRNV